MRPQLDLPSGRLMLALGAVGLAGAWTGSAAAGPTARSGGPGRATSVPPVGPAPTARSGGPGRATSVPPVGPAPTARSGGAGPATSVPPVGPAPTARSGGPGPATSVPPVGPAPTARSGGAGPATSVPPVGPAPTVRSGGAGPATSVPPVGPAPTAGPARYAVLGGAAAPSPAGAPGGNLVLGAAAAPSPAVGAAGGGLVLDGLPAASASLAILGGGARLATTAPEHPHGPAGTISGWASRRNLLVGGRLSVFGVLRPGAARHAVWLEERRASRWVTVARGVTGPAGGFRLGFTPPAPGTLALRVRAAVQGRGRPALGAVGTVNVYRLAGASWYGPGGPWPAGGR